MTGDAMIYAAIIGPLAILWISWIVRANRRDEAAIRAWETKTGQQWLREGAVKKGGLNGLPRFDRPPPPRSQAAR